MNNFKFFTHKKCEYFPCHQGIQKDKFNCLFCFCPLYFLDCGGTYTILKNGIKDCSICTIPNNKDNYDYITKKIKELTKKN